MNLRNLLTTQQLMVLPMKSKLMMLCLICASFFPAISYAKGIPLFFNTGDEIFEVKNAPDLGQGFKVGYACKHFGLFGADVWSWDCQLMAVNKADFSAADLEPEQQQQYQAEYPLSSRDRGIWNHYGILILLLVIGGYGLLKLRN